MQSIYSPEWLLCSVIIFFSAALQSTTGFGFALIAVPILSLVFDPHIVIPMVMSISFVTLSMNVKTVWKHTDKPLLMRLLLGSLIGLPFGALFFYFLDVKSLKLFVSISIIALTLVLIFQKWIVKWLKKVVRVAWLFGTVSGMLTLSVGMPGPPIVLYLVASEREKANFRAISITFLFFIYPITLTILALNGSITLGLIRSIIFLVPFSYLGILLGNRLNRVLSPVTFRRLTFVLILVTGLYSLTTSFLGG